ncbi:MAG: hypothetical protein L3K19_03905 [Thermoplasmata archaeon]|nr:hypothetical protein [Thermoplasmata archaeon]
MTEPLFSHRDRRVHRDLGRLSAGLLAALAIAIPLAVLSPWPQLGVAAILALAGSGALFIARAGAMGGEYADDLERVAAGTPASRWVHVEVHSRVGLSRPVGLPTERSPNVRPPSRPVGPSSGPAG